MYCNIKKNIEEVRRKWAMSYCLLWECIPRSDAGIYHSEEKENEIYEIYEEELVFEEGEPVGVLIEGHYFLFDQPETHYFSIVEEKGYDGGWGDISETRIYELIRKDTDK